LTVNKTLTLAGRRTVVDARTRVGAESIVSDARTYIHREQRRHQWIHHQEQYRCGVHGLRSLDGCRDTGTRVLTTSSRQHHRDRAGQQRRFPGADLSKPIQNNNNPGARVHGHYADQYVSGGANLELTYRAERVQGANVDAAST